MSGVTALVCTRNRPEPIVTAVASLLASSDVELIVVDQSPGDETERALSPFMGDGRFRYHRSRATGKGAGLNEGLGLATGAVVVLTDDDCIVPAGWPDDMATHLVDRPACAIVFCNVVAVDHDRTKGYVPAFERTTGRLLTSISAMRHGMGLGAGMAVRRDVIEELGGFDECFGPGGLFPSADEWDAAIRVLLAGWHVYETADLAIVHDGYRSFEEGREHARRDWVALGAVCAKPLRAGHLRSIGIAVDLLVTKALWPPVRDLLHARRPRGIGRITGFCSGFVRGWRTPLDRRTMRYCVDARYETDARPDLGPRGPADRGG